MNPQTSLTDDDIREINKAYAKEDEFLEAAAY